jgi:hypothetical protein
MTQDSFETRPFAPTMGDYAAYAINVFYRQILSGKRGLIHLFLALVSAISFGIIPLMHGNVAAAVPGLLFYPIFLLVFAPLVGLARVLWTAKSVPGLCAERKVTLSPDAVTINRDGLDVTLAWGTLRAVLETRKAIYLMYANEGQIILKSAFASTELADKASAYARHHLKYATDRKTKVFYETSVAAEPSQDEAVSPPYRLNFGLFAACFLRNRFRSVGAVLGLMPLPAAMIIFYAWLWRADLAEGRYATFLSSCLGFTAIVFLLPILLMPLSWKLSQKAATTMVERRIAITPRYIRGFGDGYDVQFGWGDLRRIERTRRCLFLHVQPQGVIPLPASAFPTQSDADAFFDQVKAWAGAARTK